MFPTIRGDPGPTGAWVGTACVAPLEAARAPYRSEGLSGLLERTFGALGNAVGLVADRDVQIRIRQRRIARGLECRVSVASEPRLTGWQTGHPLHPTEPE